MAYCGRYADHEPHMYRYDGDLIECSGVDE